MRTPIAIAAATRASVSRPARQDDQAGERHDGGDERERRARIVGALVGVEEAVALDDVSSERRRSLRHDVRERPRSDDDDRHRRGGRDDGIDHRRARDAAGDERFGGRVRQRHDDDEDGERVKRRGDSADDDGGKARDAERRVRSSAAANGIGPQRSRGRRRARGGDRSGGRCRRRAPLRRRRAP